MRGQVEPRELLVDGQLGSELQLAEAAQLASQVDEVPVHLFQRVLESAEQAGELARIRLEPLLDEGAAGAVVPVLRPPHRRHLPEAALDARALRLAVLLHEKVQ